MVQGRGSAAEAGEGSRHGVAAPRGCETIRKTEEVVEMSEEEQAELAAAIVRLIRTNADVRAAVMHAACDCPNIVTEI